MKKSAGKLVLNILSATMVIVSLTTQVSFAGQWVQDGANWKYQNDNGSYATNWQWIDGKSYCFDQNGNMYAGTTTPDGYTVDDNGAWIVNGVVQTQNGSELSSETPLKGRLDKWFIVEQAQNPAVWYGNVDTSLKVKWLWSDDYLSNHPEVTNDMAVEDYVMKRAIEDKNPSYAFEPSVFDTVVLSELTGINRMGNEEYYALKGYKIDAVKKEVIKFLDSFPNWQNTSDYEKAVRVCNWVHQAEYDIVDDDSYGSYGCLVNKKASCSGYTNAATLLAWVIDLPVARLGTVSHTYPVFLIDGLWLANEPTTKDKFFTSANVYDKVPGYEEAGLDPLQSLGKYCVGTGYVIPTEESQLSHLGSSVRTIYGRPGIDFN